MPVSDSKRRLTCARCGAAFDCDPEGECWCMAVPARLPLPGDDSAQCLCPDCLRLAATERRVAR